MQNAETILNAIHQLGKKGLKLKRIYRVLYNPLLYQKAYGKLYVNKGAMTKSINGDTIDGMSLEKITNIIAQLKDERYRWRPVRRKYIPKQNGKKRPLGIPCWSDKLLQEVIRLILAAYYEPQFSEHSHGFRPHRGCHTALQAVRGHLGTKWFIEGDISGYFDNIDHEILLKRLKQDIADNRFIQLIASLLKTGYLEDWKYHRTLSGAPQGGVISPVLSNIYLDGLDKFIEAKLIPQYNKSRKRKGHLAYEQIQWEIEKAKRQSASAKVKDLQKQRRELPSIAPDDPNYRRLRYVRYCDDWLLSFIGPKSEAESIKQVLTEYLKRELNLELSQEKTLITHAISGKARFLGYDISIQHCNSKLAGKDKKRAVNGKVSLRLPAGKVRQLCAKYQRKGKPIHRAELLLYSDFEIIKRYQSEYRGYVQYYALAENICHLSQLKWVMETSLLKTLANKHKSSVNKMVKKYKTTKTTEHGMLKVLRLEVPRAGRRPLTAEFGGLHLRKQRWVPRIVDAWQPLMACRSELLQRLNAQKCEMCSISRGQNAGIEVHHVRKLADLQQKGRREKALWIRRMSILRRKTLIVCHDCHQAIHTGENRPEWQRWKDKLESRVR